MDAIRQYLLSALAAAILCSIVNKLSERQSSIHGIIKLSAALFLTITVLSPILKVQISGLSSWITDYETEAAALIAEGSQNAMNERLTYIKERTEAYVLQKAAACGVDLHVDVKITNSETFIPDQILIDGNASPYTKKMLEKAISEELGIPKENQIWK